MVFKAPRSGFGDDGPGHQCVFLNADNVGRALREVLSSRTPGRGVDGLDHEGDVGGVTPVLCEPSWP